VKHVKLIGLILLILIVCACGGGGGGGLTTNATLVGRVLDVRTGGPISPAATVQAGSQTTTTAADGSFQFSVATGTTSATVDAGALGAFTYTFPAASGVTDVGDLWVGPQKITVTGRVLDSTNNNGVEGATVSFAGQRGTTNAVGTFILHNVAYSSANQAAFWGIVGSATAPNYFKVDFTVSGKTPTGGTLTTDDIRMTPSSDDTPPNFPFTIWGKISPSANATGTIVTLKQAGTAVRVYNVGGDGAYYFWVVPGTYTIEAQKGALAANDTATLTQTNQVIQKDLTLH
jgi:hypothetical protein